jgi:transcriptional regulator with XRE-family HTH domain
MKMTLGNKIHELRKKQSLSQEAFAEIMGVTRQSVSKWELDQSYPAIDKLVEIADLFSISLDDLLRNEDAPMTTNKNTFHEKNDSDRVSRSQKNHDGKDQVFYFLWWSIMSIIIMILFGIKEYMAGFIFSQILVWSTVFLRIYSYMKHKADAGKYSL